MNLIDFPEQGRLVTIRQRHYVVSDVLKSTLPPSKEQPNLKPQHLITLKSVEDDGLGEELQVIWEIEPGASVCEEVHLPSPEFFDDPETMDAFMNAVRWGAISSADRNYMQAPFRSGIEIEDYQLDPLVRAIQMPRANLLIADDVGLGKTIEAGLVIQELILRHLARTVLIVCPSSLQIQWRDQMRDKFGLEFKIIDSTMLKELRRTRGIHSNPWTHFPRLITSIDFIKRDRPMRLMKEKLPTQPTYPRTFDILIVDEAHGIAPSGQGKYATDSLRTQTIRSLAPHFEHRLFLTATPHNGYKESFSSLLEILDNQRFARGIQPQKDQLAAIMIRRLKSELPPLPDGTMRFPERNLEAIEVPYTDEEKELHRLLKEYTQSRMKGIDDHCEEFAIKFVLLTLKKRLFSSPAAFATTLKQHIESLKKAKKQNNQSFRKPTFTILKKQVDTVEEDSANDDEYEENCEEAVNSSTMLFRESTEDEKVIIERMEELSAEQIKRSDSKAKQLIDWLNTHIKPDGKWCDERVIIFTEYRATQNWLYGLLASEKFTEGDRLMTLYGGMKPEDREKIKAAFQAKPSESDVRILLATDAASEGIDLQNHCARLIHYEIPWNPNRMEQRNGRIDRHGQRGIKTEDGRRVVYTYHFVGKGYKKNQVLWNNPGDLEGDLEFLLRAARKVENIKDDLGKVGPVISQQVEEAMLGKRNNLNTDDAEKAAKPIREMLKLERDIRSQISRLLQKLNESKTNLHLSPENVRNVVNEGLKIAGKEPLTQYYLSGLTPAECKDKIFMVPHLDGSWEKCREGLAHPHTGNIRPITFHEELVKGRDDVVLAHLNHPLVQQCLRLLRAEIWSMDKNKKIHRVTVKTVPPGILEQPAIIAHARLVIIGGDCHRLHEEIISAGGYWRNGKFARLNVGEVQEAVKSAVNSRPLESAYRKTADEWKDYEDSLKKALQARMNDRMKAMEKQLKDKEEQEIRDIETILNELKKAIQDQLGEKDEKQAEQLFLDMEYNDEEKDQARRDRDALKIRLDEIPSEIEKETEQIRKRFSNPQPRMFPVAVTFFVPEGYTVV